MERVTSKITLFFRTYPRHSFSQSIEPRIEFMVGILVCGDNHFIVRGPLPDRATALALARHWSIIQIGQSTPESLQGWRISTKEFREDLQWAVLVPGEGARTAAVAELLQELSARGVAIHDSATAIW